MCTSAGWAEALTAITADGECDSGDSDVGNSGNCGNYMAGVTFMISYLVLSFLIIVNMYIAVILENYSQATEDVQEGITDEDYDLFYEIWQEFDPDGTQYMAYKSLAEFVDVLEPPLQIPKPNKFKIIHMDIPIVQYTEPNSGEVMDNMVFCTDILDALTQDFFARKGNPIEEPPHVEEIKVRREQQLNFPSKIVFDQMPKYYPPSSLEHYQSTFNLLQFELIKRQRLPSKVSAAALNLGDGFFNKDRLLLRFQ